MWLLWLLLLLLLVLLGDRAPPAAARGDARGIIIMVGWLVGWLVGQQGANNNNNDNNNNKQTNAERWSGAVWILGTERQNHKQTRKILERYDFECKDPFSSFVRP